MHYRNSVKTNSSCRCSSGTWIAVFRAVALFVLIAASAQPSHGQDQTTSAPPAADSTTNYMEEAREMGMNKVMEMSLAECVALTLKDNVDIHIAYLDRVLQKYNLTTQTTYRYIPEINLDGSASKEGINTEASKTLTDSANVGTTVREHLPTAGDLAFTWNNQVVTSDESGESSSSSRSSGNTWSVRFTQPLLKGAGIDYDTSKVIQAEIADKQDILSLKDTLINQVTKSISNYRSLLSARQSLKISENSLEQAGFNLEIAKKKVKLGRLPATDLIQLEADVASNELALAEAKNSLVDTQLQMSKQLYLKSDVLIVPTEDVHKLPEVDLSQERTLAIAYANEPGYLTDILGVESKQLRLLQAQRDWLPDLHLQAEYGMTNPDTNNTNWNVGLTLSVPLFGQERRNLNASVISAKSDLRKASINLKKKKEDIASDVRDKITSLKIKQVKVALAVRNRELTGQKLKIQKAKMSAGKSSTFELVTFQNDLFSAKVSELSAYIDYLDALSAFDQFLGTTLDTWQIEFVSYRPEAGKEIESTTTKTGRDISHPPPATAPASVQ